MADFKYVAVDAQGKTQSGELTAKDAKEARSSDDKELLSGHRAEFFVKPLADRIEISLDHCLRPHHFLVLHSPGWPGNV